MNRYHTADVAGWEQNPRGTAMRVAHFVQRYPPALGGSEAYFERLSKHLVSRGDAVTVWTTTALDLTAFWSPAGRVAPAGEAVEGSVRVRRFPLWRMTGRRWLLKPLSLIPQRTWQALTLPCNPVSFAMRRAARECQDRFDIVHAGVFPYAWPIVSARIMARRLGVPFAVTPFLHLGDPTDPRDPTRRQYTAPPLRALLRSADLVFVQTPSERRAVEQLGVAAERVILHGLGVDPAECTGGHRRAARAAWGVSDSDVVIGHLANNSVEKGTVDLVEAHRRVRARGCLCKLVLAGPEMPSFSRIADRLGESVVRLGPLSDAARRDFLSGIDIFALPSRSDSFGLVLLEAWANGVPNVVYRAGGPADLVRHGRDGLQAPCGDVEALADQLERLISDADLRQGCGAEGRTRIAREFFWPDKLNQVRDALCALAARNGVAKQASSRV